MLLDHNMLLLLAVDPTIQYIETQNREKTIDLVRMHMHPYAGRACNIHQL